MRAFIYTRMHICVCVFIFLFEIATLRIQNFCDSGSTDVQVEDGIDSRPLERCSMRSTNCDPTRCTHVRAVRDSLWLKKKEGKKY